MEVGLIGCGGIMGWHIDNLKPDRGVKITALCDTAEGNIEATRKRFPALARIPAFRDYRRLLAETRPGAVIVCTPHSFHFRQVLDSLRAGCHVLVEKPFVETVAKARALTALARRKRKVLMIAYQRHFEPKYRHMRELVRRGFTGKLQTINTVMGQNWLTWVRKSWRVNPKLSCGGELNDSGSHIIDAILWITGLKPVSVCASVNRLDQRVDINSGLVIRLAGGAIWTASISGNTPGFWEDMVICGNKGSIGLRKGELTTTTEKSSVQVKDFPGYHTQTAGFIRAVRGRGPNEVPGEFGVLVTAVTQAAYRSARLGRFVAVRVK